MPSKPPPSKAANKKAAAAKPAPPKKTPQAKKTVETKTAPAVKKPQPAKKNPAPAGIATVPSGMKKAETPVKSTAPTPKPAPPVVPTPAVQKAPPLEANPGFMELHIPKPPLSTVSSLPPALTLSVQTSAANAATGNSHPVNILVVITSAGWPVTDLSQDHFTLMQHFEVPGKMTSFSNNIVSFRNAGSGAYLLQTRPNGGAPWVGGHLLGQLLVSSPDDRQGQAAFKLIIR